MKGVLSDWGLVIIGIVASIIVLVVAYRVITESLLTTCYKDGLQEAVNLRDAAEKQTPYTLTVNGECVKRITITPDLDYCVDACAEVFGGDDQKCVDHCGDCIGPKIKGYIIVVPEKGKWTDILVNKLETLQKKFLHAVFCYPSTYSFSGTTVFESSEKNPITKYKVTFSKVGETIAVNKAPVAST